MTDRRPDGNADDPAADRLATYPEAGELGSAQGRELSGSGPTPPQPAGLDSEILLTGGSGGGLGGPAATDAPGTGSGMPGPDGVEDDAATEPGDRGRPMDGDAFVDRLDR